MLPILRRMGKDPVRVTEKKCKGRCGLVKPIESFGKASHAADGRLSRCIECTKQDVRDRKQKESEEMIYRAF